LGIQFDIIVKMRYIYFDGNIIGLASMDDIEIYWRFKMGKKTKSLSLKIFILIILMPMG